LVSGLVAAFFLQLTLGSRWFEGDLAVTQAAGLSISGLQAGRFWTLLTYALLHEPRFIFHVLSSVLLLYFLGRELLPLLGSKRFVGLFAGASLVGGLAWTAVHWHANDGSSLIGATPAVYALITLYACFFPQRELRFWLFFVVPVSLKPKHVAYALAGLDLVSLLLIEIPGTALPFGMIIASSAHLGGLASGLLYHRYFHDAEWLHRPQRAEIEKPRSARPARRSSAVPGPVIKETSPKRPDIRAEVDRILDKINSHGLASLTADEKRVLDDAKHTIPRR
jgi:membrane associated rhomboid family serine protease